jgi:hypothetical protein
VLTIELPGSAYGAVKRKLSLQVISEKPTIIRTDYTDTNQRPTTLNLVEIAHQKDPEEYDEIDALLTFAAIIGGGGLHR